MNNQKLFLHYTIILIVFLIITGINPVSRTIWILENSLIVLTGIILFVTRKKFSFSQLSYALIFIFLILGTIGSHYTYEKVPIENLKNILGTERNPHDRIVHFSFGLLLYLPFLELFRRNAKIKKGFWLYFVPLMIIIAFGAIYEILEWAAAVNADPTNASAFLGMQGDAWDAQKDMLMNSLGAVCAMFLTLISHTVKKNKKDL